MFSGLFVAIREDFPGFESSGEIKKPKGTILQRCIVIAYTFVTFHLCDQIALLWFYARYF